MPAYRIYDAAAMRAVIDAVIALPRIDGSRAAWHQAPGSPDRGRDLYGRHCAGCHGDRGEGKTGTSLANSGFQKVASVGYVAAMVARGRTDTPMPAFRLDGVNHSALTADEILDLSAFVAAGLPGAARQTQ
ncbi:MAG: c-type cytochrome [Acidobacteria bacterium]|nr:c-type cytochrome [Acidobacteriota bacterium]